MADNYHIIQEAKRLLENAQCYPEHMSVKEWEERRYILMAQIRKLKGETK